jgi:hypothetical protein
MYVIGYGWKGTEAATSTRSHPCSPQRRTVASTRTRSPSRSCAPSSRRPAPAGPSPTPPAGPAPCSSLPASGLAAIGVEREESDCELVARRLTLGDEAVKRGWDADVLDLGLDGAA